MFGWLRRKPQSSSVGFVPFNGARAGERIQILRSTMLNFFFDDELPADGRHDLAMIRAEARLLRFDIWLGHQP